MPSDMSKVLDEIEKWVGELSALERKLIARALRSKRRRKRLPEPESDD